MGHSVGISKVFFFFEKNIFKTKNLEDKKYAREIYIFNLCFIVSKSSNFDTVYEPLVQKCAEYLVDLEKVIYLTKKNILN